MSRDQDYQQSHAEPQYGRSRKQQTEQVRQRVCGLRLLARIAYHNLQAGLQCWDRKIENLVTRRRDKDGDGEVGVFWIAAPPPARRCRARSDSSSLASAERQSRSKDRR